MTALNRVASLIRRQIDIANQPLTALVERQLMLQAHSLAVNNRARQRILGLHDVEFCAFSQWGEDGIIDWLVERLTDIPNTFVEFGVENYRESNTRLLLQLRNWRGLVMDGSKANVDAIKRQDISWRYNLDARHAFIDCDNINELIEQAGLVGDIGLLSIDIDGNDYWVWQALTVISPVIVVCEYNAVLGDQYALSVPYDPEFQRTRAHHSNLYFGASLPAMILQGQRKGYTFVGTTSSGCNAFFVRDNHASLITGALNHRWSFPSATREARNQMGELVFTSGPQRSLTISDMPIIDIGTSAEAEVRLASKGELCSPAWASGRGTFQ